MNSHSGVRMAVDILSLGFVSVTRLSVSALHLQTGLIVPPNRLGGM